MTYKTGVGIKGQKTITISQTKGIKNITNGGQKCLRYTSDLYYNYWGKGQLLSPTNQPSVTVRDETIS